jgi:hypothetical protein
MADRERINAVLAKTLAYSEGQAFKGYNKHDALNSPLLSALLGRSKWGRIIAIQGVMRFPVNLRPLLAVPKTYNPKGLSLFTYAYLDRAQALADRNAQRQAEALLDLLNAEISLGDYAGKAWGYHYPWQDLGFFSPAKTPNAVVTSFVCEAFLQAYRVTGEARYLEIVERAIPFFTRDLPVLLDEPDRLCLGYQPVPMTMRVMDVSILVGAVLAQFGELSGDLRYRDTATRLTAYVVGQQTEQGAWWYTDPPEDSPISHDNYHTGFILDALHRYQRATGDDQWEEQYRHGLAFYRERLFAADGAPRWMHDREWPHDIHGAAQGILTFSRHLDSDDDLVMKIIDWCLDNMHDDRGFFYYQQRKHFTIKTHLLRWCNGWMSRALSAYLLASAGSATTAKEEQPQ